MYSKNFVLFDNLQMDKWFRIQAQSPQPGAAGRVKALMQHPAFVFTNPNKLRAVVAGFCRGNPSQFHAVDGSGYELLGRTIRDIDRVNPQIGAGLSKIFLDWTRFTPERRALMHEQLKLILATPDLSSNTHEVVTAALSAADKPKTATAPASKL